MKLVIAIILIAFVSLSIKAQDTWEVPDDKSKILSPFEFTEQNVEAGKQLYETNCMSCHGNPGQGNYNAALVPIPGDPASAKFQANSDGDIFYKVQEGKGAMPSFKNILSSSEIWNIVAYLRTYNPDYAQEVAKKIIEGTFGAEDLKILLEFLTESGMVQAEVSGTKDGEQIPVPNAEVALFARRQFGRLAIDEVKRTNEKGIALFTAPTDLPGDSSGNISFFAKLPNETLYGTVETEATLKAGKPTIPVSLRAQRAMWNTIWRAPIWLLITYFGTVIVVWSFILFIVFQIWKIFTIGKNS